VAWALLVFLYAMSTGGLFGASDALTSARFLNIALSIGVPIAFVWGIASMVWRTQEMRIVARSIGDVVARLSEPENIAVDSVTNVSQAIRREIASVGDVSSALWRGPAN